MNNQRRQLFTLLVAIATLAYSNLSLAQTTKSGTAPALGLQSAITKATRLSVLTDRLGRGHAQRVLDVLPRRSGKIISDSSTEARKLLSEMTTGIYSPASKAQLTKVSRDYELLLQVSERFTSVGKTDLAKFGHQADELGLEVDKLVELLIKDLGKPVTQILGATADLQRLTQHLAVHFLMARAGIEEKEQQKQLTEGMEAFNLHLKALQSTTLRSTQIDQSVQLINNQWLLMLQSLKSTARDAVIMENVCTTSERTLEVLNDLYALYEAALKSLIG